MCGVSTTRLNSALSPLTSRVASPTGLLREVVGAVDAGHLPSKAVDRPQMRKGERVELQHFLVGRDEAIATLHARVHQQALLVVLLRIACFGGVMRRARDIHDRALERLVLCRR